MQMIAPAHNPVRPSGSPQGEARLRWRLSSGIVPGINDGSAVTEGRLRKIMRSPSSPGSDKMCSSPALPPLVATRE
jgi:hypothetical protein